MDVMELKVKEAQNFIEIMMEFLPLADNVIALTRAYAPKIKELVYPILDEITKNLRISNIEAMKIYTAGGFSRVEAMQMILSGSSSLLKIIEKMNTDVEAKVKVKAVIEELIDAFK